MPAARHNAFISYAWVDNQPLDKDAAGWVSTFVDGLRKQLGRELGRTEQGNRVWLDYERLRGSDTISTAISAELAASRLLVPILSRGYLDSPWCRQELADFLQRHGEASGRIFPVWMSPVDALPRELEALLKYPFWYQDEARRPRTRWFPERDPTDRDYSDLQQDMARDMAARLRELLPDEARHRPPTTEPPPVAVAGSLVLVNGGDADAALIHRVADCLNREHGLGVAVPLSVNKDRAGLKSTAITRDLRDKIKLCTAVLIVFRDGPEHQINHQLTEFLRHQAKLAKDRPAPLVVLCRRHGGELRLSIRPPGLHEQLCGSDWDIDCVRNFVRRLA